MPPYIRRAIFLANDPTGSDVRTCAGPSPDPGVPIPKRARPTISRSDARADPSWVATEFVDGPSNFRMCGNAAFSINDIANYVLTPLSNRCRAEKPLRGVSFLADEYILFALMCGPPLPFYGDQSRISTRKWILALENRGFSVPNKGRYSLKLLADAFGADLPIWHPCIMAIASSIAREIRQSPPIPADFISALGRPLHRMRNRAALDITRQCSY